MTSVQERLSLPLDKWSIREKLCLASTVACSGEQNWMTVSRNMKIVCAGNPKDTLQTRPADWFSQKNCAVQYSYLLEDVETANRKKRSLEGNVPPSPSTVESPTETLLKRLTEQRMQEIKLELKREQEIYAKLYKEMKSIQGGQISDEELLQLLRELEKEQEMQRIEEMRFENQMRERELKKQELQRSWHSSANTHSSSSSINAIQQSSTDTRAVDMDVEEIIGSSKTIQTGNNTSAPMQTATSPLLTSLLKSVTNASPSTSIAGTSSVRTTAPTITTLLTGGSIPNQNKPAIIPSHDDAVHLLTRPISGPPIDTTAAPVSTIQNSLSPSQSAPTLSMLLEKNKPVLQNSTESKSDEPNSSQNVETFKKTSDSNNESVPMDIEEDLTPAKVEVDMQSNDIDDTDPNEEQQLLEVFKNIGNIEELGIDVSDVIDEEVDFLKGVDEETPLDENIDIEQRLEENFNDLSQEDIKLLSDENTAVWVENADNSKSLASQKTLEEKVETSSKVEIISSDDSNDNIPLAAVASLESSKDRSSMNESFNEEHFLKDQVESAILKNEVNPLDIANENITTNTVEIKQEILEENEKSQAELDIKMVKEEIESKDQKDDVFLAPTAEDSKQVSIKIETETDETTEEKRLEQKSMKFETKDENEINDSSSFTETENAEQSTNTIPSDIQNELADNIMSLKLQPPASISIPDTDENSSSTDISVQTRKDEKHSKGQRKSPHEANKTDDELPNPTTIATPNVATSGTLTPKPTALRKLRERDRSESPMIDDDATTHSDHSATNQRLRRRYSSTPVIDSIPNSPASSERDERDLRASKKNLLSIYNVLNSSKHSNTVQRVLSDETSQQRLEEICLRPIDFVTIKKNIETGLIRSVYELQRDIMLMCQNALMITNTSSAAYKAILQFQQEFKNIREFMPNGCEPYQKLERESKSNSSTTSSTGGGTSKGRSGSRKSLRLS